MDILTYALLNKKIDAAGNNKNGVTFVPDPGQLWDKSPINPTDTLTNIKLDTNLDPIAVCGILKSGLANDTFYKEAGGMYYCYLQGTADEPIFVLAIINIVAFESMGGLIDFEKNSFAIVGLDSSGELYPYFVYDDSEIGEYIQSELGWFGWNPNFTGTIVVDDNIPGLEQIDGEWPIGSSNDKIIEVIFKGELISLTKNTGYLLNNSNNIVYPKTRIDQVIDKNGNRADFATKEELIQSLKAPVYPLGEQNVLKNSALTLFSNGACDSKMMYWDDTLAPALLIDRIDSLTTMKKEDSNTFSYVILALSRSNGIGIDNDISDFIIKKIINTDSNTINYTLHKKSRIYRNSWRNGAYAFDWDENDNELFSFTINAQKEIIGQWDTSLKWSSWTLDGYVISPVAFNGDPASAENDKLTDILFWNEPEEKNIGNINLVFGFKNYYPTANISNMVNNFNKPCEVPEAKRDLDKNCSRPIPIISNIAIHKVYFETSKTIEEVKRPAEAHLGQFDAAHPYYLFCNTDSSAYILYGGLCEYSDIIHNNELKYLYIKYKTPSMPTGEYIWASQELPDLGINFVGWNSSFVNQSINYIDFEGALTDMVKIDSKYTSLDKQLAFAEIVHLGNGPEAFGLTGEFRTNYKPFYPRTLTSALINDDGSTFDIKSLEAKVNKIPAAPTSEGSYILECTISADETEPTYKWVKKQ